MLNAKQVKKHGMRNERWTTREKNAQYRAIIKLQAREKKLQNTYGLSLRKKVTKNLKQLMNDVDDYRRIVRQVETGDKRIYQKALRKQKDIEILLADAEPTEAYQVIFQDYSQKRKQLDELLYEKKRKTNQICTLKADYADLIDLVERKNEILPEEEEFHKRQQKLVARYQVALAKRNAAISVGETYKKIIVILEQDSKYFDVVLNAMHMERRDQCRVIYNTTLLGQLATENLDDVREKYKVMAQDVWINMKERERSLEDARLKAEDVWEYAKSLVRIESDTQVSKAKRKLAVDKEDMRLRKRIKQLEDILQKMKEKLLIKSFEELYDRLEEQKKKRKKLQDVYNRSLKDRDFVLKKKNHATLILRSLEHSVVATSTQYKSEKNEMRNKMRDEKRREAENKALIVVRGELLMNIRAALQSMASMLVCVKPVDRTRFEGKVKAKAIKDIDDINQLEADMKEVPKEVCSEPIENEGLAVLSQVTQKAMILLTATDFELDREKEQRVRDSYQNYIADYRSKMTFGDEELEQTGMLIEHVTVDPSVLTRAEIKIRSKQIVEAHTKED